MTEFLPAWPSLLAFLAASLVLAITPGPGVMYIVTRSVTQGRAAGLASVYGVALGNFGNALGAALGLAALFAASATAFAVVKYAGAAYLIYLGVQMWRGAGRHNAVVTMPEDGLSVVPLGRIFRDGLVVALLNPKTTLFFAAFLPQFVTVTAPLVQTVLLGLIFVVIATVTDSLYALMASKLRPWLLWHDGLGAWGRRMAGSFYIGLGVATALSGARGKS